MAKLWLRVYDRFGDLQKVFDPGPSGAAVSWDYNRVGGCGQASLTIPTMDDDLEHTLVAGAELRISIDEQLRYSGKLIRTLRSVAAGQETLEVIFFGYMLDLAGLVVQETYTGQGIKTIIQDILDTYVLPYSEITYSAADIADPGYSVSSLVLNHPVRDALVLLAGIAGNYEWGVDRNKSFFFKATDKNVKHPYLLGREVMGFTEERKDDEIVNRINFFGGSGLTLTRQSTMSVNVYGRKESNLFESSITEHSDANRYMGSILKASSSARRSVRCQVTRPDIFVESTTPIGAASVSPEHLASLHKYSTFKYGRSTKYGKFFRDQISNIRYQITGGGMMADVTMESDIPNVGDMQKQIEYEIRELQRR